LHGQNQFDSIVTLILNALYHSETAAGQTV